MVNQILRKKNRKRLVGAVFFLSLLGIFYVSDGDARYTGDDGDQKAIERYIRANIKDYFRDLNTVKNPKKKRDIISVRRELESLALKIDAGAIRNKSFREKVISIRRNTSKRTNTNTFVVHNFDRMNNNRLGARPTTEYAGVIGSISPWIDLSLVNEDKRLGKKMLKAEYDVTEGPAAIIIPVKNTHYFKRYNTIGCKVKGDIHSLKIALKFRDGQFLSGVIPDINEQWNTVSFSFDSLEGYASMKTGSITAIHFIVDRSTAFSGRGCLYMDDLALLKVNEPAQAMKKTGSVNYTVEGAVPLGTNKSLFLRQ
jgi:hypothetical protein